MARTYAQLSLEDRCEFARLLANGGLVRRIAAALDRSPSGPTAPSDAFVGSVSTAPTARWLRLALHPCVPPFPAMPSSTRRAFERQFNAGQRVKNYGFGVQAGGHGLSRHRAMDQNFRHSCSLSLS